MDKIRQTVPHGNTDNGKSLGAICAGCMQWYMEIEFHE